MSTTARSAFTWRASTLIAAPPPSMFSAAPMMPCTSTSGLSAAMAFITPITAALPAMSQRMVIMPSAVLMDRPPASKVTPLPMMPSFLRGAPAGR